MSKQIAVNVCTQGMISLLIAARAVQGHRGRNSPSGWNFKPTFDTVRPNNGLIWRTVVEATMTVLKQFAKITIRCEWPLRQGNLPKNILGALRGLYVVTLIKSIIFRITSFTSLTSVSVSSSRSHCSGAGYDDRTIIITHELRYRILINSSVDVLYSVRLQIHLLLTIGCMSGRVWW